MRSVLHAASVVAALVAVGWLLLRPADLPSGPAAVAWNRVSCARCGMLVGEPAFAAQVQTREGEVWHFDDPGCLLLHEAEPHPPRHAVWVHHHQQDRWLHLDAAGFEPTAVPTPMGYGLGAVSHSERPDALSREDALAAVRTRDANRAGALR